MSEALVQLQGDLSIRSIAATKQTIQAAFDDATPGTPIAIALVEPYTADLTFVQTILAAKAQADAQRRPFALSTPASGTLHTILLRAGILPGAKEDQQFWLHQGETK